MPGILGKIARFWGFALVVAVLLAAAGCGSVSDDGDGGGGASPGVTLTPAATTFSENNGSTTVSVVLTTAPNGDVVLNLTNNNTNRVALDRTSLTFNSSNWSIPQGFSVSGINNNIAEGNQAIDIALRVDAGATLDSTGYAALTASPIGLVRLTVVDDDAVGVTVTPDKLSVLEASGTASFRVFLNTIPDGNVVIAVKNEGANNAKLTVDQTSLTFTPDAWSEADAQTVGVTGVNDPEIDGNKTVLVTLAIDAAATADQSGYGQLDPGVVTVTVIDDDAAGITVVPGSLTIMENGGSDTFTVRLNTRPTGTVVLKVASSDPGEAVTNRDSSPLTFNSTNWNVEQQVVVSGVDDIELDGVQTPRITLSIDQTLSTDDVYRTVAPSAVVQLSVLDNEVP